MALETLKGVESLGEYDVCRGLMEPEDIDGYFHSGRVFIDDDENILAFKIQDGPIKEVGVNGCQVDTLIHAAKTILEGLNEKFPSHYNEAAILNLSSAITHLEDRTADREARGVEGRSEA